METHNSQFSSYKSNDGDELSQSQEHSNLPAKDLANKEDINKFSDNPLDSYKKYIRHLIIRRLFSGTLIFIFIFFAINKMFGSLNPWEIQSSSFYQATSPIILAIYGIYIFFLLTIFINLLNIVQVYKFYLYFNDFIYIPIWKIIGVFGAVLSIFSFLSFLNPATWILGSSRLAINNLFNSVEFGIGSGLSFYEANSAEQMQIVLKEYFTEKENQKNLNLS